ncbi:hypothetical protein DL762_001701 [Monosporascus cannonballus]|uniref:Kinesin light chain n=1 Tax=Monosporascus cannonballus TaxID=155416 RepID=A0ABY0HFR6_9PEZI|nr:hypothetical protein DL762_001701 [Monosporascus cannonballus]
MNNLVFVLDRQGKYDEAKQIQRQALQLSQAVLGKEHPDILANINNLAGVLDRQGKYDEAEQIHRQALKLNQAGKYDDAEQMYRQALELKKAVLGKEHPDILTNINNLADVLDSQGKYYEAE